MNMYDEMSDTEVLRAASESLSAIPAASPPDVEAIMARGRAHRRHRLSAAAGVSVSVAGGTALALGLTATGGQAGAPGMIRTASFTLASHANGTDTLTINPSGLLDTAALQNDFAQYDIPAIVTSGSFCSSDSPPAGFSQVVTLPGPGSWTPQSPPTITIDPSAMPAGAELSVGYFQDSDGEQQADMVLIDTNSHACSSTPPDPNSPPAGYNEDNSFGLLYGGPGPAGS